MSPSPICAVILTRLILYSSHACSHSHCKFMCAISLSCLGSTVSLQTTSSDSYNLPRFLFCTHNLEIGSFRGIWESSHFLLVFLFKSVVDHYWLFQFLFPASHPQFCFLHDPFFCWAFPPSFQFRLAEFFTSSIAYQFEFSLPILPLVSHLWLASLFHPPFHF